MVRSAVRVRLSVFTVRAGGGGRVRVTVAGLLRLRLLLAANLLLAWVRVAFAVGLIILGIGTGGFKSNISPLLAEQQTEHKKRIETLPSGERVIVDPAVTTSRIFLYFYLCINIGSLVGQIGMVSLGSAILY